MPLTFYPHSEDAQRGSLEDRIATLMEAAERYKAIVLDVTPKPAESSDAANPKLGVPRELTISFNWEEIAIVLREIRELPEATKGDKGKKGDMLAKLAEVYEVLRSAKMSKLEAVRLALMTEATQLRGSAAQAL